MKDLWSHPPIAAIQWLKNLIVLKYQLYPHFDGKIPRISHEDQVSTSIPTISPVSSHYIPIEHRIQKGLCRAVGLHIAMHQVMFLQEVQGLGFQRKYGGYHWEIWGNYGENIIDQWWIMSFNGFNVAKYGWWVGLCEWFWWSLLGGSSHLVSGL